ncbi:cytochrome P450 family protein, partial [Trifolium medium]|nr:cytochrome P450 family protein [Trifolium medium]
MVAQEKLYEFLNKRIAYYKGDKEKRRLRSNEDVDESNSCLLKELMKEGILEKGEKVEKYIRDTAINLLLAGNGS